MNYRTIACGFVAVISLAVSLTAGAAAPQGGGGFPQMSPEMQQKMQAWRDWRTSHPNIDALQRTVRGLSELEQGANKLNKNQATIVLYALNKWRKNKVISDSDAHGLNGAILATLSQTQQQAMTAGHGPGGPGGHGGWHGGTPGGGGRPGGGHGGGFHFDPSSMPSPHDYNPLNPDTLPFPPMRDRARERMNQLLSELKATAQS